MSKEIRIGLLAIVAIAALIWGYKFLLGNNLLKRSNTYFVEYKNVNELKVSDPVVINGFQIGTVQNIYLKDDLQTVVVVLNIRAGIKLPQNTIAVLYSTSVMGGKAIELKYSGVCDDDCLTSGSQLRGREFGLLGSLVQPNELDTYMNTVSEGIGNVMDSLSAHMTEGTSNEVGKTFRDLQGTIANLNATTLQINRLLANSSDKLVGILDNLQQVTENINTNNAEITGLLQNANSITEQLASARLDSTILKTNRTLGSAHEVSQSLESTLTSANQTFAEFAKVLSDINASKGTLGKLVQDQALYDNLLSTTRNLELLLQDFRLNPKRYTTVLKRKSKEYVLPENDPAFDSIPVTGK